MEKTVERFLEIKCQVVCEGEMEIIRSEDAAVLCSVGLNYLCYQVEVFQLFLNYSSFTVGECERPLRLPKFVNEVLTHPRIVLWNGSGYVKSVEVPPSGVKSYFVGKKFVGVMPVLSAHNRRF